MKKTLTTLTFILCGLAYSQVEINQNELQTLKLESQKKYDRDLAAFKLKKGLTPLMIKNFAGYEAGIPVFYEELDLWQAVATNTNWLYNEAIPGVNLSGIGMRVYIWDGGFMNTTHQDFQGRAFNKETNQSSSHATNVAGVIVSAGLSTHPNGNNSKGMAYNASVYGYDFYGNTIAELAGEAISTENSEYLISNNSWGQVVGWSFDNASNVWRWYGNTDVSSDESVNFGLYGFMDSNIDHLVYNSPQVIYVKSSGNNYGGGPNTAPALHYAQNSSGDWVPYENVFRPKNCGVTGFDCIPIGGLAKNIITVGAVNSMTTPYSDPNSVSIASFSSVGPADDGRIKPDIVAVGTQVYTPSDGSSSAYTITQGTSFSAPQASGNILLLQELYKQKYDEYLRADLVKAIVIHTANEAGQHPGPDYVFGWGLMDMKKAAEVVLEKDNYSLTDVNVLQNNSSHTFQVKAVSAQPLKVTISWLDPQASPSTTHNDRSAKLINDLDLRVSDGLITYYPWKLDVNNPSAAATKGDNILDNTEQVVIETPVPGQIYTITISHKGNLTNNQQVYALVASGIEVGCKAPSALTAYEITSENARLKWSSSQTVFDVEFGLQGFTPTGNPTHANVSNEYLIEDLTEGVAYEYYVRAKCEDSENSSWAGPYSFVATSEIVYEGSIGVLLSGPINNVNTANPCAGELTIEVPTGKKIASVNVEYSISNINYNLASDFRSLIYSPTLGMGESSFASVSDHEVNFTANYSRELPFLVSATGSVILQLRVFDTRFNDNYCYGELASVDAGSWKVTPIYVDQNACLAPVEIYSVNNSTSSFTINWLSDSNVDIVYGESGFEIENGTLIQNISGNSHQITNQNTNLVEYYLRSNCGGENTSNWVGPFEADFSYCGLISGSSTYETIKNITFSNLNNSKPTHASYSDFTHLVADVVRGQTYPLSVLIDTEDNNEYIYAYIDWNQNLQFEQDELIQIANNTSENGPHIVNVTVPENAVLGNTRMRVVLGWNEYFYPSCGVFEYGEVEDYTVNVSINEVIWTTEGVWSNITGPTINDNAVVQGDL